MKSRLFHRTQVDDGQRQRKEPHEYLEREAQKEDVHLRHRARHDRDDRIHEEQNQDHRRRDRHGEREHRPELADDGGKLEVGQRRAGRNALQRESKSADQRVMPLDREEHHGRDHPEQRPEERRVAARRGIDQSGDAEAELQIEQPPRQLKGAEGRQDPEREQRAKQCFPRGHAGKPGDVLDVSSGAHPHARAEKRREREHEQHSKRGGKGPEGQDRRERKRHTEPKCDEDRGEQPRYVG